MDSFQKVKFNGVTYDLTNTMTLGIDEQDGLLYLYVNDKKQGEGIEINEVAERFTITRNVGQSMLSNPARGIVDGGTYESDVEPFDGYKVNGVTVTMGGELVQDAYDPSTGKITVTNVSGNLVITVSTKLAPVDMLDITWANHAITCGQDTDRYNAWCPNNLQYDDVHDCFVFLQSHANKHSNKTNSNWTLSIINPYDPTDVEVITIPAFAGLGNLFVENGVWTLMPRYQSYAYRSSDMGETWETLQASIPQTLYGVYKCGDTYFGGNDLNSGITYFKSYDLLTWTEESFDAELGYTVLAETSFYEFDGKYWAFSRTNDSTIGHPAIFQSTDGGDTWTLFSDELLHGWRSTPACMVCENYLMIADVDREGGKLYYTQFDGTTMTQLNEWTLPSGGNDLHSVNLVTNYKDTVILEFMHTVGLYYPADLYYDGLACDNVMIVGSLNDVPALNKDTEFDNNSDFISYANENLNTSIKGNTYTWDNTKPSGANIGLRCVFPESITTFADEVEMPLNMMYLSSDKNIPMHLMNANHVTQPWNNALTPPDASMNVNSLYSTCRQVIVGVNGVNHAYVYNNKTNEFPVLTRVTNYYNVALRGYGSDQNDISGEEWQEQLGFRRVIGITRYKSNSTYVAFPKDLDSTHKLALFSYSPVE